MKALAFERYGDNSVLRLMERPVPEVGPRDVRVRIEAASVNPLDFKIRSGALKRVRSYPLPQILGNDFAGVVDQVGAEVTRFKAGDPVFARVSKDRVGAFAEYAASDELFVYDRRFRIQRSFRSRYLKHCHEISARDGRLFLTSTGFDSILHFDLKAQRFSWALHVSGTEGAWVGRTYDPHGADGPPPQNRLHLNNVHADDRGLYFSGMRTRVDRETA